MNIPYVFKKCSKCGEWLVASSVNFYKHKRYKYGLIAECKECRKEYRKQNKEAIAEYMKEYREQNKEAKAEYMKKWYEENKETRAKYNKEYYEENKDDILEQQKEYGKEYRKRNKEAKAEYHKKWYEANREAIAEQHKKYHNTPHGQVVAFNKSNRRRTKEQAQGRGITKEQWLECMSFFNWQCAYSGITLSKETRSLDHIEPINKGGVNEIWNVVPMYLPYNSSKYDKDMLEWYTEQDFYSIDRLNKIYEWQEYAFNKWGIDTEAQ